MKTLTILVPNGQNNLSSIVGTYKIFNRANAYYSKSGKAPLFEITLAGTSKQVDFHESLFTVNVQKNIEEIALSDLIIIPSLNHNYEEAINENKELIAWIRLQYKRGAEIASICTGAFILAATGILDGKRCSTHWSVSKEFSSIYPKVDLQTDQLITDENGIYTNGGAFSFLNLIIYLVEKFYGREIALLCAKVFQIDISRNLQAEFSIFKGQKQHDDESIKEAQKFLEENYYQKLSIEALANKLSIGRRNFDRRFKKATSFTPIEYLQHVKVEAAKKAFENTRQNISEVMYEVGYNDAKAFREVFSKLTGLSPLDYRMKYNKERALI
ncbi:MAG: GlxA family transcriptional regulator [Bacteroidota bacterium]